jgi:hypothetical protein
MPCRVTQRAADIARPAADAASRSRPTKPRAGRRTPRRTHPVRLRWSSLSPCCVPLDGKQASKQIVSTHAAAANMLHFAAVRDCHWPLLTGRFYLDNATIVCSRPARPRIWVRYLHAPLAFVALLSPSGGARGCELRSGVSQLAGLLLVGETGFEHACCPLPPELFPARPHLLPPAHSEPRKVHTGAVGGTRAAARIGERDMSTPSNPPGR